MRLAILILAALAAFAQEDKLQVAGSVIWAKSASVTADHLTLDFDSRYKDNVLIIRKNGEPLSFCNIRMGRCWDLVASRKDIGVGGAADRLEVNNGTLRVYDSVSYDGATLIKSRKQYLKQSPGEGQSASKEKQ